MKLVPCMKKFFVAIICAATVLSFAATEAARFGDNYRLEKVLILSRHNLRSPHVNEIKDLTPHKWFKWTSNSRELSLRGGLVETELGQYFRKYLVDENFMTENYMPVEGEFLFYANARQRTIATAQYFSSGLLPVANARIEYTPPFEKHDPVFGVRLTYMNDNFRSVAEKELMTLSGVNDLRDLDKKFSAEFALMAKLLDFKNSPMARKTGKNFFSFDDGKFVIEKGKQPTLSGNFSTIIDASDSLVLQYYETSTAFGQKLNDKQVKQLTKILNFSSQMTATPEISVNIATPLITCMNDELNNDTRRFTFLCGHDTNLASVTGALRVEDYSLPDTVEDKFPIGGKLVIEKWRGADGAAYATLNLVYPSTKQIRDIETLTLDNPPKIFPLRLKGLQANADGFYLFDDVKGRFTEVIAKYDSQTRND